MKKEKEFEGVCLWEWFTELEKSDCKEILITLALSQWSEAPH